MEQIIKLAAAEAGKADFVEYHKEVTELFDFLAENGYIEYRS